MFEYLNTDENEKKIYANIIINIKKNASMMLDCLNDPAQAAHYYTQVEMDIKRLQSLIMLRKMYIGGIINNPRSDEEVLTVFKDSAPE